MYCPLCQSKTRVLDSRVAQNNLAIRRRRECLECDFRFSTYEEMELLDFIVTKKNGATESYNRAKLENGLRKAFEKRPVSSDDIHRLALEVEVALQQIGERGPITTRQIGELVMKKLKRIDEVAYIRFASVYKSFTDARQFEKELQKIITN